MGRYRPSPTKKSPYITQEGYQTLQSESVTLWVKRREVVKHLAAAAAEGDRSENAEYIYRKKQLREMDRRIGYLQRRLPELKVVNNLPANQKQIFFGAWITLEGEDGKQVRYRIVGADEFDPKQNWISIDSPMARALLKKSLDEDVDVQTPGGNVLYQVIEISYAETRPVSN